MTSYPFNKLERGRKVFSTDSVVYSKNGCEYKIHQLPMSITNEGVVWNALFYLRDNKFYLRWQNPESKDFVLFDLDMQVGDSITTTIYYSDDQMKTLSCKLLDKFTTTKNLDVFIFLIKDCYYYYHDPDKLSAIFDVKYFVTKKHGIVGYYLTTMNSEGKEIVISPVGEIFRDYIDYSKKGSGKLL